MGGFKYSVWVPKTVNEALALDKMNGNNLWREAIMKEMSALQEYNTFRKVDRATFNASKDKYQFAPLRMIFDVKQVRTFISSGYSLKVRLDL